MLTKVNGQTPQLKVFFTNNVLNPVLYPNGVPSDVSNFASHFAVGPEPCGNVTTFQSLPIRTSTWASARVDYQINSKQSLFVRYFGTHSLRAIQLYRNRDYRCQNAGTDDTVNSLVLGHTYLVSTSALNTFHFTFNTDGITKFQVPIVTPTDIGVQGMYIALPHFSNINITGDFQSAGGFATPGLVNTKT